MSDEIPFNFTTEKTIVFKFNDNMAVDGSINRSVFSVCNVFEESVDITRFIVSCVDDIDMDDAKFCSITDGLERGLMLRKLNKDGYYINYWNVKNNQEFVDLAYDVTYSEKAKQGEFGLRVRISYAGADKRGVVIRLEPDECIEGVVQDNLISQKQISIMPHGHFVQS